MPGLSSQRRCPLLGSGLPRTSYASWRCFAIRKGGRSRQLLSWNTDAANGDGNRRQRFSISDLPAPSLFPLVGPGPGRRLPAVTVFQPVRPCSCRRRRRGRERTSGEHAAKRPSTTSSMPACYHRSPRIKQMGAAAGCRGGVRAPICRRL